MHPQFKNEMLYILDNLVLCRRNIGCLAVFICTCVGCGPRDKRLPQPDTKGTITAEDKVAVLNSGAEPVSPRAGEDTGVVVSLDALGFVNPDSGDTGEFKTEDLSQSIGAQLAILGEYLRSGSERSLDRLKSVSANEYRGVLRPTNLDVVFQDDSICVRRQNPSSSAADATGRVPSAPAFKGHVVLAEALKDLRSPLDQAHQIDNHFKVFRIENKIRDRVLSRVLFEQSGRLGDAKVSVQQRSIWDCEWQHESNGVLHLAAITVTDYEETTATLFPSGGTSKESESASTDTARTESTSGVAPQLDYLMTDRTASVLGNSSSYVDQFSQSTDYWLDRLEYRYGIDPGGWLGLSVADVNGDGLADVYFCQPGGLPNRLYVQQPDGTAVDSSRESGLDWLDHSHAALFVDLDNDGDQDLALAVKPGLIFMQNDGQGKFQVASIRPVPQSNPYALSANDYNADGLLDVYVCCYSRRRDEKDRQFIQRPIPYHDANNGGRNLLLRNEGVFRFRDVTLESGLDVNNRRFSFAAAWEDYDNDGDCDLYVANDYGRNNLYRNDGGSFLDVANQAGVEDISAGMSVTWGDYNNDGWMDLYVSNMFSSAGNRIAYQRQFRQQTQGDSRAEFQRHAKGNSLFQNMGDGTFRDVSEEAGVTIGRWAWSSLFFDVNNDGWQDIFVANGFITQEDTRDL